MEKKHELVAYNTNDASLFTVIHSDGCVITEDQFEIVKAACKLGPYFTFFVDEPGGPYLYRLRGPYQGLAKFWIVDATGIAIDDTQKQVMALIKKRIAEIKENF